MTTETKSADIAITGMACRFAGCADLRAFWLRLLDGTPAVKDMTEASARRYRDPGTRAFDRVSTLRGGYLDGLWNIAPTPLGLNAAMLAGGNPEQVLALYLATQALKDAGYADKALPRERTALFLGYSPYMDRATISWFQKGLAIDQTMDLIRRCFPHGSTDQFEEMRRNLLRELPAFDSRNLSGFLRHALARRIAARFDIQGPSGIVDAGCASALLGMGQALDELRTGRSDLVLCGGLQGRISPQWLMIFNRLKLLSGGERPHPFGRDSDGTLFGEGGGMLVLKRLEDARRDGDRIYALVKEVGAATDIHGRELLNKSDESLARAMTRALKQAGVQAGSIALLEAHGSGILTQDRAELRAMCGCFGPRGPRGAVVALGSVKALIGHCFAAAGTAGIIKASLSLYHRILPPAQEADRPNPQLKLAETPFYLNAVARPWVHNDAGQPRRAGVNAMTFGGVSAHVLMEQHSANP